MKPPIVFINIGWMKRYQGPSPTDELSAKTFGYFKTHRGAPGHEQWNFLRRSGWAYGYVPRTARLKLERLGASPEQDQVTGVLVVFVSRDPVSRQHKVVGWYRNAIVNRNAVFERNYGRVRVKAPIKARASESYLLPVSDRNILIPAAKTVRGGLGQSPIWYAERHPKLVQRILRIVRGEKNTPRATDGRQSITTGIRNLDPDSRIAIEKAAMELAMKYFDGAKDVSKQCKGWDIEAIALGSNVLIEVKGLAGSAVSVELTPNEFTQMNKHKERYLLFVVNGALARRPLARSFRYRRSQGKWVCDDGSVLKLQERIGARASV
jgi:hypothetical protein